MRAFPLGFIYKAGRTPFAIGDSFVLVKSPDEVFYIGALHGREEVNLVDDLGGRYFPESARVLGLLETS